MDRDKIAPTVRTLQLEAVGDLIDRCSIKLLRCEALARAIFCGLENCLCPEQMATLSDMIEEEAYAVRQELNTWWESLTNKGGVA
jgi:hypothetical protein